MFLDTGLQNLQQLLASVISITTDMGTKLGFGEFGCEAPVNLLLGFVLDSAMVPDAMECVDGNLLRDTTAQFLFNQCITVAGMLHGFPNTSKGVYKSLACWSSVCKGLKTVEKVVANKVRLNKFANMCVGP